MEYTPRMNRVAILAVAEAERRPTGVEGNYVSTEHFLLALAKEGEGVAARVLHNLGVTPEAIEAQVEEICPLPKPKCQTCGQEIKG